MDYESQEKLLRAGFEIVEKVRKPGWMIRRKRHMGSRRWEDVRHYMSERELDREMALLLRGRRLKGWVIDR